MGRDRWLKNRDVHPSAAIDGSKIASESITTTQIDDLTIATADLANYAVTALKIANYTVTASQMENYTVTAQQIANYTVTAAKIANNVLGMSQMDETIQKVVAADVSITAAQVANMHTTAIEIVAVPGANKAIVPIAVLGMLDYSGGAFGNVAAGDLLQLSASSTPANTYGAALSTGILDATADKLFVITPSTVAGGAVTANTALYLGLAGAVTIDSSTSVLKVRTYYQVLPTTFA